MSAGTPREKVFTIRTVPYIDGVIPLRPEVCSTVCIRNDHLITPSPRPRPSSLVTPFYVANERMRNCVSMYTPWSTIWSDHKHSE
jgi:hypothetical protein